MSIDARTYADSAVTQGKSALAHAGTALGQAGIALGAVNRRLLADAPKPVYAALGAADLVASAVGKRAEQLPTDAAQGANKAQQTGQSLLTRAQTEASTRIGELRERVAAGRQVMTTLPDTARVARENYLQAAKGIYATLTDRGEARAAELRQNPRVAKLLGQLGETAGEARDSVAPVAKAAFDTVTQPADTEPTVAELSAKPTSKPAGAGKGTARKAAGAKKATGSRTPSSKA